MPYIEFVDVETESAVYINSDQIVCVRAGYDAGTTMITTTANANDLHNITVDEEIIAVVKRLKDLS